MRKRQIRKKSYTDLDIQNLEGAINTWKTIADEVLAAECTGLPDEVKRFNLPWQLTFCSPEYKDNHILRLQNAYGDLTRLLTYMQEQDEEQNLRVDAWSQIHPTIAHFTKPLTAEVDASLDKLKSIFAKGDFPKAQVV